MKLLTLRQINPDPFVLGPSRLVIAAKSAVAKTSQRHLVESLNENYKVGVSVCVFGVIFPHTWGTRIKLLRPLKKAKTKASVDFSSVKEAKAASMQDTFISSVTEINLTLEAHWSTTRRSPKS
jgi:hypothetical protein